MGSNKKNTLPLKFKLTRVDTLLAFSNKITPCKKNNFICRYGQILDLLTTFVDVSSFVALSQYYDPPLRCFTFKDFQLVPTIEEYEMLLGWYVKDHLSFTNLGEMLIPESVVEAFHLFVKETEKVRGNNHRWFELDVKEKKALRDESDLEIQKLNLSLHDINGKVEVEHRLKKETIRVSYITPLVWREKCHKVELATLSVEHWRDHFSVMKNESLGWLNEKTHMNGLLDTYVGYINLLQPAATMY
ncbi:hypothetical protein KIW84_062557 [Lathyrus oleraceus]|uniref:DUF7745 domain-containing protein n=1 Tax=Pisum sativum TaxID=3888 RepID=A0A9D4W7D6_PEA|nr:hypothetical protein KIW84_062557 [Pisum sativum]